MEWVEVGVSTSPEGVELVFGALLACGISGAQIIDHAEMRNYLRDHPHTWDYLDEDLTASPDADARVIFYVSADEAGFDLLARAEARLAGLPAAADGLALGSLALTQKSVCDDAWLHEWKKHYKPFRIGCSVVVKPFWEPYCAEPGDCVFTIDPGSVFGTGLHPSTRLCIESLERYIKPGVDVLDIGCGSGILSLVALLLGAEYVFACDSETAAVISARGNAALNPVPAGSFEVESGDVFTDERLRRRMARRKYAIVTANITADAVIKLSRDIKQYLRPDGVFIASGIIAERLEDVREAFARHGLTAAAPFMSDGWYCLISTLSCYAEVLF